MNFLFMRWCRLILIGYLKLLVGENSSHMYILVLFRERKPPQLQSSTLRRSRKSRTRLKRVPESTCGVFLVNKPAESAKGSAVLVYAMSFSQWWSKRVIQNKVFEPNTSSCIIDIPYLFALTSTHNERSTCTTCQRIHLD